MTCKIYILALFVITTILSPLAIYATPSGELINGDFDDWSGSAFTNWTYEESGSTPGTLTASTGRGGSGLCASADPRPWRLRPGSSLPRQAPTPRSLQATRFVMAASSTQGKGP